jgi:DNA-binding NarL/FixJ family response regulator
LTEVGIHVPTAAGSPRPRAIIADDHRLVAEGLAHFVRHDFEVAEIVVDGPSLYNAVIQRQPDIVVADLCMPGLDGLEVLRRLRSEGVAVPFVIVSMHGHPAVIARAMQFGANGYVVKTEAGEKLTIALREALAGRSWVSGGALSGLFNGRLRGPRDLTPRQLSVAKLIVQGHRSKQIAVILGLSVRTVETHKQVLLDTLNAYTTIALVKRLKDLGISAE